MRHISTYLIIKIAWAEAEAETFGFDNEQEDFKIVTLGILSVL